MRRAVSLFLVFLLGAGVGLVVRGPRVAAQQAQRLFGVVSGAAIPLAGDSSGALKVTVQ